MLERGGETVHARAEGQTTAFLYVYEGQGAFGAPGAAAGGSSASAGRALVSRGVSTPSANSCRSAAAATPHASHTAFVWRMPMASAPLVAKASWRNSVGRAPRAVAGGASGSISSALHVDAESV